MNKSIVDDLTDASDATEHLMKRLKDLSLQDKVDIAARLRAVAKNCEAIDKSIKADISKKLKEKDGVLLGDTFKACLKLVSCTRFNQAAFKEANPKLFDDYCEQQEQQRITFEAR